MEQGFRRSMGWLHTWAGVVLGSVLFAVFWMGTLSVFDNEIDRWMKPATRLVPAPQGISLETFRPSLDEAIAAKAAFWNIILPNDRQPVLQLRYKTGKTFVSHEVDPASGHILPDSGTLGGTEFIFPFHYTLQIELMDLGEWVVGLAAMAMLVLCVSGVIIHRKIFAEFFTFRPYKKSRRILLDLHNVCGVLGLPFHIFLTFSGLVILGATYFPAGVAAVYSNPRAYFFDANNLSFLAVKPDRSAAPVVSLDEAATRARAMWGGDEPQTVLVANPGKASSRLAFFRVNEGHVLMDRDVVAFSGATGALISRSPPLSPVIKTQRFLSGLHLIQFHHWVLRWVYFVLGMGSCVMIATGFLFWQESRRKTQGNMFGFRLVEGLTSGSVTGIILATLAFFVSNRLLPANAHWLGQGRAALEVWVFYTVWFATFVHGWVWPRTVWLAQSAAIAVFAGNAVLLNWVTTGDHPLRTLSHRYLWPVAGMDMVLLVGAGLALLATMRLARRAGGHSSAPRQAEGGSVG